MGMKLRLLEIKYWYKEKLGEQLIQRFVWKLPSKVILWSAIRLMAHATTGEFRYQNVPELTALEALDRWKK
jgi:hypothetical protein